MEKIRLTGPRVSALSPVGRGGTDGTNDACHGSADGVEPHDKAIIANVRVMIVCWGRFYSDVPSALDNATALCKDLVTGPYMNGLAQYGVGRGSLAGSARIDDTNPPAALSEDDARDRLLGWLRGPNPTIPVVPAVNEKSLLYVLFPPPQTKPTIASGKDDFCGYHHWAKLHDESADSDLFWALVRTDKADKSWGEKFIKSVSYCVSHEIAEAVSSRDGRGYYKGSCEIGDLCEQTGTHDYRGWQVEQYWSQWDNSCANGENAISVRRFLRALKDKGNDVQGRVRGLHTAVINQEYIASRFR